MHRAPDTFLDCVGIALREWRTTKWSTQTSAALAAGVTQGAWSRWETGDVVPDALVLFGVGCDLTALFRRATTIALEQAA